MPSKPVTRPPTDPEKLRKNALAAKKSRGNKEKGLNAYKAYHHEMEQWIPQLQARYDRLLELLREARPCFGTDALGTAIDDALADPMPEIPDTVVIERTETLVRGPGRPAEFPRRRCREYASNPPSHSDLKAPIAQPALANPTPSAVKFADQTVMVPYNSPYQFDKVVEQPDMELWDLDSTYDSASFSPKPSESYNEALRNTVFYGAGFAKDDTFLIKPLQLTDSDGGGELRFDDLQREMEEAERQFEILLANWENGNELCKLDGRME